MSLRQFLWNCQTDLARAESLDAAEQERDSANQEPDGEQEGDEPNHGGCAVGRVAVGLGGCDRGSDCGPERQCDQEGNTDEDEANGDVLDWICVRGFLLHRGEHRTARHRSRNVAFDRSLHCVEEREDRKELSRDRGGKAGPALSRVGHGSRVGLHVDA